MAVMVLLLATVFGQPPHPHLCHTPKTGEPCLAPMLPSGCNSAGAGAGKAWCNRSKPAVERAAAAVRAMNLTEKVANTGMPTSPLWDDRWNLRLLPGCQRLGIPSLLFGEIAHGVASPADPAQCLNGGLNCSTSFPATLVLAASFDRALWREVGAAAGLEGRAWANGGRNLMGTIGWAPNINGARSVCARLRATQYDSVSQRICFRFSRSKMGKRTRNTWGECSSGPSFGAPIALALHYYSNVDTTPISYS